MTDDDFMIDCPNCETAMEPHRSAGRGRYKPYPDLRVCPKCWVKYTKIDGKWVQVSRTGELMR